MITASALAPNCAYAKVLSAAKPRRPDQQAKMDRGTAFHALVERWVHERAIPAAADMEMQGWLNMLALSWRPTVDTEAEIPWGLSLDGAHVHVAEPLPHVYEAIDGTTLLTAGRADAAWESKSVLHVADWKAGRWPVAPAAVNLQVNAAGMSLAQRIFTASYKPGIYYVQDGVWDWGDEVLIGSPAHAAMFEAVKVAATLPPEPRPGDWCAGCWERRACPMGPGE